jgi:nitrate/nitrite-specific signal transduction histidine kinase
MKHVSLRKSSVSIAGSLAALVLLVGGCSSVVLDKQGDMEATYIAGEFRMLVNGNAAAAASATSTAFKQLGLFQLKFDQETYKATLTARTPKDEKVTVNIAEVNSRQSTISIRVDILGDRSFSRRLYEQIDKNLSSRGGW